jgi:hypothetical protein
VQFGANEGAMHPRCNGANPYIGIAPLLHLAPPEKVQRRAGIKLAAELVPLVMADFIKRLASADISVNRLGKIDKTLNS